MMKKCHPCDDLGVTLIGGNAVGIFVHVLHPNMVASSANGLRCGDHILEVGGFVMSGFLQYSNFLPEKVSAVLDCGRAFSVQDAP